MLLIVILLHSLFFRGGDGVTVSGTGHVTPGNATRFPDATVQGVVVKGPPFDVDAFLESPPDGRNAAPLYLAAMSEFDDQATPPAEGGGLTPRVRGVSERKRRINALYQRWQANRKAVTDRDVAPLLTSLLSGYKKLAMAQERPDCVFPPAYAFSAPLPHVSGAKTVHRATVLKTHHELNRGDIDAAIGNVEMMLRLSRDLRPQGPVISQLVASFIGGTGLCQITGPILNHPNLTVSQCDHLLEIIQRHQTQAIDCYAESLRVEYLMHQVMLHDVEHETGAFSPDELRTAFGHLPHPPQTVAEGIVAYMEAAVGPAGRTIDRQRSLRAAEKALSHMASSGGYEKQRTYLNDAFSRLLATSDGPFEQRKSVASAIREELLENPTDLYLLTIFFQGPTIYIYSLARNDIAIRATTCQIAARRWQLQHNGQWSDLATMVSAAGMAAVPIDPFSAEPLKMTVSGNDLIIYSVGDDGKDDGARIDSQCLPERKGDVLFRMSEWT